SLLHHAAVEDDEAGHAHEADESRRRHLPGVVTRTQPVHVYFLSIMGTIGGSNRVRSRLTRRASGSCGKTAEITDRPPHTRVQRSAAVVRQTVERTPASRGHPA